MTDDPGTTEIPLISKRRERAKLLQKVQHAIPAVPLLGAGIQRLTHGAQGFALALAVGELIVSALLLRALVQEVKALRRPAPAHDHHHRIDGYDILAAGVLTAEALEHWHTSHHLPRPMILLAVVTLLLGLCHGRIAAFAARRRLLRIDEAGIRVHSRLRQDVFPWADLESIELDDHTARLTARGGRQRRIDLRDLRNADEVRAALLRAKAKLSA